MTISNRSNLDLPPAIPPLKEKTPTIKQIRANGFTRFAENGPVMGNAPQGLFYGFFLGKNLNKDELTDVVTVGNVIRGLFGLVASYVAHRAYKKHYRTGHYNFTLFRSKPDPVLEKMENNAIWIYQIDKVLHYRVKDSSGKLKEGTLSNDDISPAKSFNHLIQLTSHSGPENSDRTTVKSKYIYPKYIENFLIATNKRMHTFSEKTSTNPLYRNAKTGGAVGWQFGAFIANYISILGKLFVLDDNKARLVSYILSTIFSSLFALMAFPYKWYREWRGIPPNTPHEDFRTGTEGSSKFLKTALEIGIKAGQAVGAFLALAFHYTKTVAISFSISFWGGAISLASVILYFTSVYLINRISRLFTKDKKGILTSDDKNKYRNNYTRSGMTLGGFFGALFACAVGLLSGNFFGVSLILGATICSAVGSVLGGIALSISGNYFHERFHKIDEKKKKNETVNEKNNVVDEDSEAVNKDKKNDIENSYDYVSRSTAGVFSFIGMAIACGLFPGSALIVAPIGAALAAGIGWFFGIGCMKLAQNTSMTEEQRKADFLPWTQRIISGSNIGYVVGCVLGIGIGVLGGPIGITFCVTLFGAIGAVIGGVIGALCDKKGQYVIFEATGMNYLFGKKKKFADELPAVNNNLNNTMIIQPPDVNKANSENIASKPQPSLSPSSTPPNQSVSATRLNTLSKKGHHEIKPLRSWLNLSIYNRKLRSIKKPELSQATSALCASPAA